MKIFLINSFYEPLGGAEQYFYSLSDLLRENGHDVFLFTISDSVEVANDRSRVFHNKMAKNLFIKPFDTFRVIIFDIRLFICLKKLLKTWNPEIVHLNNNNRFSLTILLALRGYPVVHTIHDISVLCPKATLCIGTPPGCKKRPGIHCITSGCLSWIEFVGLDLFMAIKKTLMEKVVSWYICPSVFCRNILESMHFSNLCLIRNFVGTKKASQKNMPYPRNILFIGRIIKEKGLEDLLLACPEIFRHFPCTAVNVVGAGPDMEFFKEKADYLGISHNVVWHGHLTGELLSSVLSNSTIVINPSHLCENQPLSILEAMSAQKVVIASDRGGVPEIIENGIDGFLIEPKNPGMISDLVLSLFRDQEIIKQVGISAQQKILNKFDKNNHYFSLMGIYQRLLKE